MASRSRARFALGCRALGALAAVGANCAVGAIACAAPAAAGATASQKLAAVPAGSTSGALGGVGLAGMGGRNDWSTRAPAKRFEGGAEVPAGCFAWSAKRGHAACVLGQWPFRRATEARVVSFLGVAGAEPAPLALVVHDEDLSGARDARIATGPRVKLDVAMRDGGFVELPGPTVIAPDAPPRTVGAFSLAMKRKLVRQGEGDFPSSHEVNVTIHAAPSRAAPPLLDESFGPAPCEDPVLKVFELDPATILVERSCRLIGEGKSDLHVAAWICDAARRVCR